MNDTTVTKMHLVCPHCNATNRVPSDKLQAELNCGKCQEHLLTAHPDNLGEAAFNAQLAKSELPMVVDFWAPWCGPCRMLAPIIEKLAVEFEGKAVIAKLNTDVAGDIAGGLGVSAIPTVFIFSGGKAVARLVGVNPEAKYRDELNKLIG